MVVHGRRSTIRGCEMPVELKFGDSGVLEIDLPAASLLGDFSSPRGIPLDDPAAAVAAAVSDPLEFPRLQDATIPGDLVVLAVDGSRCRGR